MSLLSDKQIIELCTKPENAGDDWKPMLENFIDHQVKVDINGNKIVSYGVSSYGYDLRVAPEFFIFTNINSTVADPLEFDEQSYVHVRANSVIIPPNSFALSRSLEKFNMPRDVTGVVVGKSTLARIGCVCVCTPIEAAWCGFLTLEFCNSSPLPMVLRANQGGCQVLFFRGEECLTSYADRGGKYQNQPAEIVLPRG